MTEYAGTGTLRVDGAEPIAVTSLRISASKSVPPWPDHGFRYVGELRTGTLVCHGSITWRIDARRTRRELRKLFGKTAARNG